MLKADDKAPDFILMDQNGKEWQLSKVKGIVALYFYPKDDTPGCTAQACSIRDGFQELKEKGITVLGVSKDSVESHKKFSEKYHFFFPILSDSGGKVCEAYGAWLLKSFLGREYMGIKRTTFLIKDGKILKVIEKVDVAGHARQILTELEMA